MRLDSMQGLGQAAGYCQRKPALGGRLAIEFLGTVTGQQLLDDLLLRNLTGTYA
jgi:hypothetical protein